MSAAFYSESQLHAYEEKNHFCVHPVNVQTNTKSTSLFEGKFAHKTFHPHSYSNKQHISVKSMELCLNHTR